MSDGVFTATHQVPDSGIQTWSAPDPSQQPENRIEGGQPVELLEETTGWARVRCSNGWETWVDARLLLVGAPRRDLAPVWSPLTVWLGIIGAALATGGSFLPWYSAGPADVTAWDLRVVTLVTHDASDVAIDAGPVLLVVVLAMLPC